MVKTFLEARDYLESFIPDPIFSHTPYQLDRMRALCALLGNPQNAYPIIHVGGTSGKGSTATFASFLLANAGLKTGLHTSPHLESLTERIQINNQPISRTHFVELIQQLIPHIEKLRQTPHGAPSYFEILVAMTFLYFKEMKVDAAVIEVGLGGTLDGTNVIPPSVCIITNISLDHTNILGKTTEKIAREKMGIIKPTSPAVISGITQPHLKRLLRTKTNDVKVPLYLLHSDFHTDMRQLRLKGSFQHTNFSLAKEAVFHFLSLHFPDKLKLFTSMCDAAARDTFIPGRMEIVKNSPLVMLDGAHNGAKIKALVSSLVELYPHYRWLTIVAIKKGKPARTILRTLEPLTRTFYFTQFTQVTDTGLHQSTDPVDLVSLSRKSVEMFASSKEALYQALSLAEKNRWPVLVTGSLYLVGEIRALFKNLS